MFRELRTALVFDVETVPSVTAGRRLFGLDESVSDREVIERFWKEAGATAENPRPFVKPILTRVVSLSFVMRVVHDDSIELKLVSLPPPPFTTEQREERQILSTFFRGVGHYKPMLVGFNSRGFDLPLLFQRAVISAVPAEEFCRRPDKPWNGIDYWAKGSEAHIDLMELLTMGAWGKSPKLHEVCVQAGIPGKFDVNGNGEIVDGEGVADLWLEDRFPEIVAYNDCDACSTYLLFLRVAHVGGKLNRDQYFEEQNRLEGLLTDRSNEPGFSHLKRYLAEWKRLRA